MIDTILLALILLTICNYLYPEDTWYVLTIIFMIALLAGLGWGLWQAAMLYNMFN